jgi:hypothetical protein
VRQSVERRIGIPLLRDVNNRLSGYQEPPPSGKRIARLARENRPPVDLDSLAEHNEIVARWGESASQSFRH